MMMDMILLVMVRFVMSLVVVVMMVVCVRAGCGVCCKDGRVFDGG